MLATPKSITIIRTVIDVMVQVVMLVLNDSLVDDGWGVMVVARVAGTNYAQRASGASSVVVAIGGCNGRETIIRA